MLKVGILDFKNIPTNRYFYTPKKPINQPLKSYTNRKKAIKNPHKKALKYPCFKVPDFHYI